MPGNQEQQLAVKIMEWDYHPQSACNNHRCHPKPHALCYIWGFNTYSNLCLEQSSLHSFFIRLISIHLSSLSLYVTFSKKPLPPQAGNLYYAPTMTFSGYPYYVWAVLILCSSGMHELQLPRFSYITSVLQQHSSSFSYHGIWTVSNCINFTAGFSVHKSLSEEQIHIMITNKLCHFFKILLVSGHCTFVTHFTQRQQRE